MLISDLNTSYHILISKLLQKMYGKLIKTLFLRQKLKINSTCLALHCENKSETMNEVVLPDRFKIGIKFLLNFSFNCNDEGINLTRFSYILFYDIKMKLPKTY